MVRQCGAVRDLQVLLEVSHGGASVGALPAGEGALAGLVGPLVLLEGTGVGAAVGAVATLVRLLARVDSSVLLQVALTEGGVAAVAALLQLHPRTSSSSSGEPGGEGAGVRAFAAAYERSRRREQGRLHQVRGARAAPASGLQRWNLPVTPQLCFLPQGLLIRQHAAINEIQGLQN